MKVKERRYPANKSLKCPQTVYGKLDAPSFPLSQELFARQRLCTSILGPGPVEDCMKSYGRIVGTGDTQQALAGSSMKDPFFHRLVKINTVRVSLPHASWFSLVLSSLPVSSFGCLGNPRCKNALHQAAYPMLKASRRFCASENQIGPTCVHSYETP